MDAPRWSPGLCAGSLVEGIDVSGNGETLRNFGNDVMTGRKDGTGRGRRLRTRGNRITGGNRCERWQRTGGRRETDEEGMALIVSSRLKNGRRRRQTGEEAGRRPSESLGVSEPGWAAGAAPCCLPVPQEVRV